MIRQRSLTCGFVCMLLSACASSSDSAVGLAEFSSSQQQKASQLSAQGRLAESLAFWRTVLPLSPENSEVQWAIQDLEARINKSVTANLLHARKSYGRGSTGRGDFYMLKVLALNPGNKEALTRLGASYSAQAQAQQASKAEQNAQVTKAIDTEPSIGIYQQMRNRYDASDYGAVLALSAQTSPADPAQTRGLIRSAHIALAEEALSIGKPENALDHFKAAIAAKPEQDDILISRSHTLEKNLSRHWYQQGVRLTKTDLPRAIAALEKSLSYDANNQDAKIKLQQSKTLLRNLQKIEGER